jgi:hypothetical protein
VQLLLLLLLAYIVCSKDVSSEWEWSGVEWSQFKQAVLEREVIVIVIVIGSMTMATATLEHPMRYDRSVQ